MIIECSNCNARLDVSGIPKSGQSVTIKCTQCGHLIQDIRVDGDEPRSTDELFSADWQVRKVDGEILSFGGLPTLRSWISAGRILPEDEISADGVDWKPVSTFLGDAALSLHHQRPGGRKPPPLPTEMGFPRQDIPKSTIDAPDPEEEFEEAADSIDERPTLNYSQSRSASEPLPKALPLPGANQESDISKEASLDSIVKTNTVVFTSDSSAPPEPTDSDTLPISKLTGGLKPSTQSAEESDSDLQKTADKPTDGDLLEAVDYLTTSESRALRIQAGSAFESGERPDERSRSKAGSTSGLLIAIVLTATISGGATWYFGRSTAEPSSTEKSPISTNLSVKDRMGIVELLAEADRLIAQDTDGGRNKAEKLYDAVIARLGPDIQAPTLSGRAHLGRARVALIRAEYARLTGQSMSVDTANAKTAIQKAETYLKDKALTQWIGADLQRLNGNSAAVETAVFEAEKRGERGAKWLFLKAMANLYGNDKAMVLKSILAVERDIISLPRTEFIRAHLHLELGQVAEASAIVRAQGRRLSDHAAFKNLQTRLRTIQQKSERKSEVQSVQAKRIKTPTPKVKSVSKSKKNNAEKNKENKRLDNSAAASGNNKAFAQLLRAGSRLLESGRVKQARKKFQAASVIRPKDPRSYANLGWCAMDDKAYAQAAAQFRKALTRRPRHADGLFGLGYAYEKQGSAGHAIRAYERYLRYHPKGRKSRMIKTRLLQLRQK